MIEVTIFSRSHCHLCDAALATLVKLKAEFEFNIVTRLIDGNSRLEEEYGESVPVILINGKPHDFFRVDPERFRKALSQL